MHTVTNADINHPEEGHPTFPETIPPDPPSPVGEVAPPTSGTTAGAIDYRANPSTGQTNPGDIGDNNADRDNPSDGGTEAGPPPDRTIQSYDLPDQLANYNRTRDVG